LAKGQKRSKAEEQGQLAKSYTAKKAAGTKRIDKLLQLRNK